MLLKPTEALAVSARGTGSASLAARESLKAKEEKTPGLQTGTGTVWKLIWGGFVFEVTRETEEIRAVLLFRKGRSTVYIIARFKMTQEQLESPGKESLKERRFTR